MSKWWQLKLTKGEQGQDLCEVNDALKGRNKENQYMV